MIKMNEVRDSKDDNLYSLEEMIEMYEDEPVNYSYVSRRLCCPHCRKKVVKIKIDEFFERITSNEQDHHPWCDYYNPHLSQRDIKKVINDPVALKDLFKFKNNGEKQIPRRNIERYLSADDFEIWKIFYGTVTIRTAHSKDETKYKNFAIKAPKGEIINLTFNQEVIKNGAELINTIETNLHQQFKVKFITKLVEVDEYVNGIITDKEHFVIEKITELNTKSEEK